LKKENTYKQGVSVNLTVLEQTQNFLGFLKLLENYMVQA
jgi:hypothetical protein